MRLWSAESCRGLDEFLLPDKAPLVDFDFDEGKVMMNYLILQYFLVCLGLFLYKSLHIVFPSHKREGKG